MLHYYSVKHYNKRKERKKVRNRGRAKLIIKRVEQIQFHSREIGDLCHKSKNLYNFSDYIIRQEFFNNGKWIRYNKLYGLVKASEPYKELPAKSAQQTLKVLDRNWKSFFEALKSYKNNPELFTGKPKPPKYLEKNGEYLLICNYSAY